MSKQSQPILVTGSLAYDFIMDFPGFFSDHILPEKIHQLNISFGLNKMEKKFGGTGGNIAYTLSLFKAKIFLVGSGGNDFYIYKKWLIKNKIDLSGLKLSQQYNTAAAYIMTDKADNQIAGFYAGAMNEKISLPKKLLKRNFLATISPEKTDKMFYYGQHFQKAKIDYVFDPGQAIISLSKKQILFLLKSAKLLIANDYEIALLFKKINSNISAWQKKLPIFVTYGPEGSKIFWQDKIIKIKAVKVKKALDPTGAGDAYRAGLLFGLAQGLNLSVCASLGATAASYAIEKYGTQEHHFTLTDFNKRLYDNFNIKI